MPARLSTYRPSKTTVSFAVSNAPTRTTLSSKLTFSILILLRILLFLSVILIDAAKARYSLSISLSPFSGRGNEPSSVLFGEEVWLSSIGGLACWVADRYSWPVITAGSVVVLYVVFRKGYTEESLLVIRGMGIQTSTSSAMYWSSASTRFIPTTQIQDIVIHEAFKAFEVRFYLAIIVEGESDVVVVFPNLLPKRLILEEVWRGARRCLYEKS